MRIYIPVTANDVLRVVAGEVLTPGRGYAATEELLESYSLTTDEEEIAEYVAMSLAAHASRVMQQSELIRRIVVAADVSNVRPVGTADAGVVDFLDEVRLSDIASVHADNTAILATSVDSRRLDDASELLWWAVQEIDTFVATLDEKDEKHG